MFSMIRAVFDESTVVYEDFESLLTPRELQCLRLRSEGKTLKQIGLELGIGEFTVRNYMTSIYDKTGIRVALTLCHILRIAERRSQWNDRQRVKGKGREEQDDMNLGCDPSHRNIVYRNDGVPRQLETNQDMG